MDETRDTDVPADQPRVKQQYHLVIIPFRRAPLERSYDTMIELQTAVAVLARDKPHGDGTRIRAYFGVQVPVTIAVAREIQVGDSKVVISSKPLADGYVNPPPSLTGET